MGAIQQTLERFGKESVDLIRFNMNNAGQSATGQTALSIESNTPKETKVIVDAPAYIYVLETGRKPGKMPPVSKIESWIEARGVSFEKTVNSSAWAISVTIAKEGTKLFRQGGRRDIITPVVNDEQRYNLLVKEIADISFKLVVQRIDDTLNG